VHGVCSSHSFTGKARLFAAIVSRPASASQLLLLLVRMRATGSVPVACTTPGGADQTPFFYCHCHCCCCCCHCSFSAAVAAAGGYAGPRLLSVGQRPGHDFFEQLSARLVGYNVPIPTVQIEYRSLSVTTEAMLGSAGIPTAGNFAPKLIRVGAR
jgi:hypothetical protein